MPYCPRCGVPQYISSEHLWLDNGDIVQTRDPSNRMVFFESENLDPLFRNIEAIIGTGIDHVVVTASRRAVRAYLSAIIPREVVEGVRSKKIDPHPIADSVIEVSKIMGYGEQEFLEYRLENDEEDYCIVDMIDPFSVPFTCGVIVGAVEAIVDRDFNATFQETPAGTYRVTVYSSGHPEELKTRMWLPNYAHTPGDLDVERCVECGGAALLSSFEWQLERGFIINKTTGRRMVLIGPAQIDPIFEELEEELGETIPEVVVEAQKRFTKGGFYRMQDVDEEWDFRAQLALRGLGNLREIRIRRRGLQMTLGNVALPLLVVGTMQGVFEAAFKVDSSVEWEVTLEGDLRMEVLPRT
jgi:hypothetical protein